MAHGRLAVALLFLGALGCKGRSHVASKPDGAVSGGQAGEVGAQGSDGSYAVGGVSGSTQAGGGRSGTGGTGGVLIPDAGVVAEVGSTSADGPVAMRDGEAADVPLSASGGDGLAVDGGGGTPDGALGETSGISDADPGETGTGITLGLFCTTDQDCPADSRCCNGSDPSCDGTRLPTGDRPNPEQFLVSAGGLTITDTITGLTWQRDGAGARAGCSGEGNLRCTWNEAQATCASLTLNGFDDWRLPGWNELLNITDLAGDANTPPLDQRAFPGTPMEGFWTSSKLATASCTGEIYINFTDASLGGCAAQPLRVRCVRGSRCYPKVRFVVLDTAQDVDGPQVRDTLTGLVWQQLAKTPAPECANWREGQTYCASLGLGFRLPTYKELESLVGPEMRVDRTIFSPTRCDYTWTSTPYGGADATLTGKARCPRESALITGQNVQSIDLRYGIRCVR